MPKPGTKQESPISANANTKAALKRLVQGMNEPQINVLEKAVIALEDYWNRHGERALLPLRFDETFVVYKVVIAGSTTRVVRESPEAESNPGEDRSKTRRPAPKAAVRG